MTAIGNNARRMFRAWSGPATWALLDQGASAGANFVMQIVLARHLAPEAYGAFNVTYAVYLVLLSVPNLVIFEPMVVLGQRRTGRGLDAYAAGLFRVQLGLSVFLAAGLAGSRWLYPERGAAVADASLWFAAAAPALMAFQFLRRACYLRAAPGSAFAGSAMYAAVMLAALWWRGADLSVAAAIACMGASALVGGAAVITVRGWWAVFARPPARRTTIRDDVVACWRSGRWLLGSGLVGWLASSAYLPLAAVTAGLGAAGAVRAVDNLFQPVGQGLTALAGLASPWLARRRREFGDAFVRGRMWALGLAVAAAVAGYALVMWGTGERLMRLLYGADTPYAVFVPLIPIMGVIYTIRGLADVGLGTGLRALGNWRAGFVASSCGAAVMVVAGVPLVRARGLTGILLAMALAGLAQLGVLALASRGPGRRSAA